MIYGLVLREEDMTEQSYANHRRFVPLYHYVLAPVLLLTLAGSIVNLCASFGDHGRLYGAALIAVLSLCAILLFFFARLFALKAQDRAILAQENLRHFVLAGKPLDARLTVGQVIALRFASDGEFADLARRAAEEGLSPDAIKRAVRSWRPDTWRV